MQFSAVIDYVNTFAESKDVHDQSRLHDSRKQVHNVYSIWPGMDMHVLLFKYVCESRYVPSHTLTWVALYHGLAAHCTLLV